MLVGELKPLAPAFFHFRPRFDQPPAGLVIGDPLLKKGALASLVEAAASTVGIFGKQVWLACIAGQVPTNPVRVKDVGHSDRLWGDGWRQNLQFVAGRFKL